MPDNNFSHNPSIFPEENNNTNQNAFDIQSNDEASIEYSDSDLSQDYSHGFDAAPNSNNHNRQPNFIKSIFGKILIAVLVLSFFGIAVFATVNTLASINASNKISQIIPQIQNTKETNKDFLRNSTDIDSRLVSLQSQKDEFWSKPKQVQDLETIQKEYSDLILKNQSTDLVSKKDELSKIIKSQLNESNQKLILEESDTIKTNLIKFSEYSIELQKFEYFKAKIDEVANDEKVDILLKEISGLKERNSPLLEFYSAEKMNLEIGETNELDAIIAKNQNNKTKSLEELKIIKNEIDEKYEVLQSKKIEIQAEKKAIEDRKKAEEQRAKELERLKQLQINSPEVEAYKLEPKVVVVDIASQSLIAYEYGVPIQSTFVTTGKDGKETVTGEFRIFEKKSPTILISPFVNEPYRTKVNYWMPFFGGYGLHDASWRSEFGGQDYRQIGSHGCVNMPYSMAQWMYGWAEVGTKVVVN
jgi:lipoprotein-anchoring transpeptidase ErfK/SrfK